MFQDPQSRLCRQEPFCGPQFLPDLCGAVEPLCFKVGGSILMIAWGWMSSYVWQHTTGCCVYVVILFHTDETEAIAWETYCLLRSCHAGCQLKPVLSKLIECRVASGQQSAASADSQPTTAAHRQPAAATYGRRALAGTVQSAAASAGQFTAAAKQFRSPAGWRPLQPAKHHLALIS